MTQDASERLWAEIERVSQDFHANRLRLGRLFLDLRNLYSERNSGGRRLNLGHGTFEEEIRKRGFNPRRVREWIIDFEVSVRLRSPSESTAAKRKARRSNSAEYQRGYHDAIRQTHASLDNDPLVRFAQLLPYSALKAAKQAALQELHPDHGGSDERTRELLVAWKEIEELHASTEEIGPELTVQ